MLHEPITTSVTKDPVKIIRDTKGHRVIKIYESTKGYHARHSHYPAKRWQRFRKDLPSLIYLVRQEFTRLRNADVGRSNLSEDEIADFEYLKLIARGHNLRQLADEWNDYNKRFSVKEITIDEAAELYLERHQKEQTKQYFQSSSVYVKKLAHYASGTRLVDVANPDFIERYGQTLKGKKTDSFGRIVSCEPSGSQKKANRSNLKRFFTYLQHKGYLPETLMDPTRLLDVKKTVEEIRFISPSEANDLVIYAPIELFPHVVLGKFIGIRPEEGVLEDAPKSEGDFGYALLWEDFLFDKRRILFRSQVTKLKKDKVVIMDDLVFDLLSIFQGMSGPVFPLAPQKLLKSILLKRTGREWIKNGLRHSCATMRIQRGDDRLTILSEMQTSNEMLRNHYDESAKASPGDYLKWFGLRIPADHSWESVKRDRGFVPNWYQEITPEFVLQFNEKMREIAAKYPLTDLI